MDGSPEDCTPPRRSPVCLLATPESSPKTESEARRAAERIALRLEVMATTPLEDTRPIPLVDFTLSSPELDRGSEITTTPKRKTSRVPRRRLFHSPEKPAPEAAKESMEGILDMADQFESISLLASTPLSSPGSPACNATLTEDAEEAVAGFGCRDSRSPSPACTSPNPQDTAADRTTNSITGARVRGVLPSACGDEASSEVAEYRDKVVAASCGAGEGAVELMDDDEPTVLFPSVKRKDETFGLAADKAGGIVEDDGDASMDDREGYGISPPSSLGESFDNARDCPPTDGAADKDQGRPSVLNTTFTVPESPSVETRQNTVINPDTTITKSSNRGLSKLSSRATPLVRKSLAPAGSAPEQRPARRLSVPAKPKAVLEQTSAVPGKPRATSLRPSVANANTTCSMDTRAPKRTSLATKSVAQAKPGPTAAVSKAAPRLLAPPVATQQPATRHKSGLPEPRKLLGPPAGATAALKSLQTGARRSVAAGPRATEGEPEPAPSKSTAGCSTALFLKPSQGPPSRLRPPNIQGARRSVGAVPRATEGEPEPASSKGNAGLSDGSSSNPSQKPPSRLRPPSTRGRFLR